MNYATEILEKEITILKNDLKVFKNFNSSISFKEKNRKLTELEQALNKLKNK